MFLVDSHCHLDGLDYQSLHKDVDDVLAKAAARDVKFCLAVATTLPGYRHMRELVGKRDNVVFSCGVHPLNQDEAYDVEELRLLAAEDDVVAMGETGLDYFYTPETKIRQQASFIHHIQIGRELHKPVICPYSRRACRYAGYPARRKSDGLRRRTTLFYRRQRNGRQIAGSGVLYLFFRHRNVP